MARFNNLFEVSQVLVDLVTQATGIADVRVGPPPQAAAQAAEAVHITLLWTTPQPGHRNNSYETQADGTRTPPPLSLSAYYLITTYGQDQSNDSVQAHNLLGQVMQTFHTAPRQALPLTFVGSTPVGTGDLSIVQMPIAMDVVEKVFTPLQVPHRPWALYDIGPVQLPNLLPDLGEAPLVRPGGVNLLELDVRTKPAITRVTPSRIGAGGSVRVDYEFEGPITEVLIGRARINAGVTELEPNRSLVVELPDVGPNAVDVGTWDLRLSGGSLYSDARTLTVLPTTVPSVDAPAELSHGVAADLVLAGRALSTATEVFFWPDDGVAAPSEVVQVAVSGAPFSVTVPAAQLAALNFKPVRYRVTVRHSIHGFTPFVLLEFRP